MAVQKQNFEFPDQKIVDVNMQKQVEKSFIEYSMSVIVARALPDVRDGLKPGQRRVLYAMYEDHLTHDKPFRKSATTVGNVLGRYHPHGDASVYGTMVRMAQSFSLRYPLVEGHGNFGSVDGDPPAAYRYTEARLAKISEEMMRDIEKNVVKFVPNFDNRLREPSVLPSRIPNLLVNGSVGIAVGMATNIPPHNLGEVIDATLYRMDHPDCTVEELMQYVKGPDFPTKGIIYGNAGILQAYRTGMGRMMVRARAEVNEEKHQITIREIPYSVNKSLLVQAMAQLVKDKKVEGIRDIRDLSSDREGGIRILIDCRQDANCQVILNQLYKYTQLQDTFAINMLALVNNEPRVLSLPQILDLYLGHQEEVITNRTRFDLEKAKARAHILEGYTVAIDNIDEVVHIMKHASSIPDAKETLMSRFGLTDVQAQAIVEMTLGRLTGMERQKVEEELAKLLALIEDLEDVLRSPERVKEIIREEMTEISRKYGDARRTEIVEAEEEIDLEDLIPRHTCVITMSHQGYVKRQPADTYEAQNRGGRGKLGMTTKEEDFVENVLVASSHDYLMFFTNMGKVYTKKVYRIPEASRTAKGSNVVNILDKLAEGEFVTSMISVSGFSDEEYLTMVTEKGVIKRTQLSDFEEKRKGGKIAIGLDEGDHLLFVRHTKGDSHLIVATRGGRAIRFAEDDVRCMGRQARGVRGIRMAEGDVVVGVTVVDDGKWLLTVTENGLGKLSAFEEFTAHNRGGQGVRCHDITEKTGLLAAIATVAEDDDIMIITSQGTLIRTGVESIRKCGRTSQGVIVMRVEEGDRVMTFARLEKAEEIASEAEAAGERNAEADAEAKANAKEEARIPNPEDMTSDDFAEE